MTVPFNEPFNEFYDDYSIRRGSFAIPDHWQAYVPDNAADFGCLSVISPDPALGATRWTLNGRWITVGVYRDEGRDPAEKPATTAVAWTRTEQVLTFTVPDGHKLEPGDSLNLYNVNVAVVLDVDVLSTPTPTTFTVPTVGGGAFSGVNGAFMRTEPVNFAEENYVFRLLPSFKLVPYSVIQDLFTSSAPTTAPPVHRTLYNVTTGLDTKLPRDKNKTSSFEPPRVQREELGRRFDQIYDEQGNPLKIAYTANGEPVPVDNADSQYKNEHSYFDTPIQGEEYPFQQSQQYDDEDHTQWSPNLESGTIDFPEEYDLGENERVFIYDFYGLDLNDVTRGPYFAEDIITRDTTIDSVRNNFLRKEHNGNVIYEGKLFDVFGNLALGIQTTNALFLRACILPLELDRFNRPVKAPSPK